ncbi:MAG: hypothetical protein VB878_25360 [Pirellulaceae bacterium]
MQICDFLSHAGRIRRATTKLKEQWQETLDSWNDNTSRQFQQTYLDPLLPEVTAALAVIQSITEQIHRAERDCQDPDREDIF